VATRAASRSNPHDALAARFAAAMAHFAPFERSPHLAVAASGGADSTALAALACDWARTRDGRITALIVDHGLRAGSSTEARAAAAQLKTLGADTVVLAWSGSKPVTGVQAAARAARYRLLGDWCARHGVLHLLVAHHADDQAETAAMRAGRGSGPVGLAGMSAIVERAGHRILRPLLGETRATLRAFAASRGLSWIEDPSNTDPRFARTRLRAQMAATPVFDALTQAADLRRRLEARRLAVLARAAALHPFGFARLDPAAVTDGEVAPAALGALIAWAGGRDHLPSEEKLAGLWRDLRRAKPGRAATLGGCRVHRRADALIVAREAERVAASLPAEIGIPLHWDGRFVAMVNAAPRGELSVGALGRDGMRQIRETVARSLTQDVPQAVLAALPALRAGDEVVSVPALNWRHGPEWRFSAVLRPRRTLVSPTFAVA